MTTYNYLTHLAEVRPVPGAGFGSFAISSIPRGTVVATFGGTACNRATFDEAPEDRRSRSIQIDDDLFLLGPPERELGDCVNHSCAPNSGPRNGVQIVAMRDIEIGEEITFDYGTTDGSDYDSFECACGTPECRRIIAGTSWKDPDMQRRYVGWFSPYLQRRIAAMRDARTLTKSEVELMLNTFDDDPVAALERAIRIVLGRRYTRFDDLILLLSLDATTKKQLLQRNVGALDALARDLNESRGQGYFASP